MPFLFLFKRGGNQRNNFRSASLVGSRSRERVPAYTGRARPAPCAFYQPQKWGDPTDKSQLSILADGDIAVHRYHFASSA